MLNQKKPAKYRTDQTCLKWLAYFDIFQHPLTEKELRTLSTKEVPTEEFKTLLDNLVSEKRCYHFNGFYCLAQNAEEYAKQRIQKQKAAEHYFKKLPFYARLIAHFPHVKGLAISGSLSKGVIHDDGDIDYFVITETGRLWICRTLLVLFKKVFLLNSKKYFCVNYFVDDQNLKIPDENVYTAVEIAYLLPVYQPEVIREMKEANRWSRAMIPSFESPLEANTVKITWRPASIIEFLLRGKIGDRIDLFLMQKFYAHWNRKFKHFSTEKMALTMRTNRGVSKHHPQNFQHRVLEAYQENLKKFGLA